MVLFIMLSVFWVCLYSVFHAYFGYPLSLFILGMLRCKEVRRQAYLVPVTLIITAFNEEKRIREKLANSLALEYPKELLQILVASDGSTDTTNEIVSSYRSSQIDCICQSHILIGKVKPVYNRTCIC